MPATDLESELNNFDFDKHGDLFRKGEYMYNPKEDLEEEEERLKQFGGRYHEQKKQETKQNSWEEINDNLEYLYEQKKARLQANQDKVDERMEEKRIKKMRFMGVNPDDEVADVKMGTMEEGNDFLKKRVIEDRTPQVEMGKFACKTEDLKSSKWFDRDIFSVMGMKKKLVVQDAIDDEDDGEGDGEMDEEEFGDEENGEGDEEEDSEGEDGDEEDAEEGMDEEELAAHRAMYGQDEDDLGEEGGVMLTKKQLEKEMLRDLQEGGYNKKEIKRQNRVKRQHLLEDGIDPDQRKVEEDDKYDGRYDLNVPLSERALLKEKNKLKNQKKNNFLREKDIQYVPQKKLEDFDMDELAQDLAVAKKMIRKKDREEILDASFNRLNNFEYDGLPNWYCEV